EKGGSMPTAVMTSGAGSDVAVAQSEASSSPRGEGGKGETSSRSSTGTGEGAGRGDDTISEIVVTAQKRQEKLQTVPISMTVLTGKELDSSTAQGVSELLNRVPGVAMVQTWSGGATEVIIRGILPAQQTYGGASPSAYYLDSVPFGFVRHALV